MKIKAIKIIHLKSFERCTINLSQGINLFIGENNSGKSTIIQTLLNLQYNCFNKRDMRSSFEYSRVYIDIENDNINELNYSFFDNNNHEHYEFKEKFSIVWSITASEQPEELLYINPENKYKAGEYDTLKIISDKSKNSKHTLFPRFSSREDQGSFIYPFLAKRKTSYNESNINKAQAFSISMDLRNLASKIQTLCNPSHPKSKEFTRLCEDILGFTIGTIATESDHSGIEPGIFVTSTNTIPISSMGEGVANIVGFLVTLLTEDNRLYLIEELENDIHPKALKKLLNLIITKADKNQFIISTHSHIVLKYLGSATNNKIFYLDWKPNLETESGIFPIPTSTITEIQNTPENRINILEKLGYDFQDYELYDAYLLLEEASAERIIRDVLILNFVPELYGRLKTIGAKGIEDLNARAIDFNRLFTFIHTNPIYKERAWIIADGDEAGKKCIQDIKKDFKSWPEANFINFEKRNFEEYYPERFKEKAEAALSFKAKEKREAKKILFDEVMDWVFNNRVEAIKEFGESASEVISILKGIAKKLNQK